MTDARKQTNTNRYILAYCLGVLNALVYPLIKYFTTNNIYGRKKNIDKRPKIGNAISDRSDPT